MRVKYLKDHKGKRKGETEEVSRNVAFGLIDSGVAEITKDMSPDDYRQAGGKHGKSA